MPEVAPPEGRSDESLHRSLHEVFGFSEFRAHQEDAIRATLEGRDTLLVMPTGAGKSLCFQLPAAISEGVTIVVSPLVALMRDQVEALRARTTFNTLGCAYINSLQGADEQRELLEMLRNGWLKLVYVAPERFRSPAFLSALKEATIARFVVDEAHCISEWGHDFRPDYLALKDIVQELGAPPLQAVTATATLRVQKSIVANLGMRDPTVFIGGFNRPNLHFSVHRCKNENEREQRLEKALPRLTANGGSGLIYAGTRKQCEEIAALASKALAPHGKRAGAYHAGMDASERNAVQANWLAGHIPVLVATNAFGMGIDKADVRFVVHCGYPDSLESYYQEAGRAGRDGRKSRCVILYHFTDRRLREYFIENDVLTADAVATAHKEIRARATEDTARIPRLWWSQKLGWSETKTRLAIGELERAGLLRRAGESGDEMVFRILKPEMPPRLKAQINADLERLRQAKVSRLDDMTEYCKTRGCRRAALLSYFGDSAQQGPEFCCDGCERVESSQTANASAALPQTSAKMPASIDPASIHDLLQALDALRPRVGKNRLNKLLRGSTAKDMESFRKAGCPLHGALRGSSEAGVDGFLDALVAHGLLHQADEEEYFVCSITGAGREAWTGKLEVSIASPAAPVASRGGSKEADLALFEALRAWRQVEADAQNVPSYHVLGDRTLQELARMRPADEEELLLVPGIGEVKAARYGDALLAVVRGEADIAISAPLAAVAN